MNEIGKPAPNPVKMESRGNTLTIESPPNLRITTLDELIEYANVDLSEWRVDRWLINKWEVGAKTSKKRLRWEDGQIVEGEIDDSGELTIEPLIQVKAWLIRRNPEPIFPTVNPVSLKFRRAKPTKKQKRSQGGLLTGLILPDPQIGFRRSAGVLDPIHDRSALSVALKIAQSRRFDFVVWLGDLLDLPDWSTHFIHSPDFSFLTNAALRESAWWLWQFVSAQPDAEHVVLEGNHEKRIRSAIEKNLPAAYDLKPAHNLKAPPALSIENLLGLADMGITWVGGYPQNRYWLNRSLAIEHGKVARSNPGDTAKKLVKEYAFSVIFGHVHRAERATRSLEGKDRSQIITAATPGCLCRLDGIVPGHDPSQDWSQGVAVVNFDQEDFNAIEIIPIEQGRAVWSGEIFTCENYADQIETDARLDE